MNYTRNSGTFVYRSKFDWKDKLDSIRGEVALIEKLSHNRVTNSSQALEETIYNARQSLPTDSSCDNELRLEVNSFQYDLNDLQEEIFLNDSAIEDFKIKQGMFSDGIFLGERDRQKAAKAATLITKLFRKLKCIRQLKKKKKQWLQSKGLEPSQSCLDSDEDEPPLKLKSMPHIAGLLTLLAEPLDPLVGWLFKSTMSEKWNSLTWQRFWVRFTKEDPKGLEISTLGGSRATDSLSLASGLSPVADVPMLLLSSGVMESPSLVIPLQGCTVHLVEVGALNEEHCFQFELVQPSGRKHWFSAPDEEAQRAWYTGLQIILSPSNQLEELLAMFSIEFDR